MSDPESTADDQVEETTDETETEEGEEVPFEMPQVIVAGIDPETETFPGL